MFWQKNEEEVEDLVEIGETLPSGDGSFQKTIYLVVESGGADRRTNNRIWRVRSPVSPPHSHHSEWGFHSEDDYGDEDYDDEDYDEDYDDEDW
ncbi:hypothetical protein NFI96_008546 [Prochilodus magdalenae]|nr:hypothetical protein NFI96_008546 [Prochilodus magdalenae]